MAKDFGNGFYAYDQKKIPSNADTRMILGKCQKYHRTSSLIRSDFNDDQYPRYSKGFLIIRRASLA